RRRGRERGCRTRRTSGDRPELTQVRPVRPLAGEDDRAVRSVAVRPEVVPAEPGRLLERDGKAAVAHVVRQREPRGVSPEPGDQLDRIALGEPGTITGPPATRDCAHIGHEADAAD